MARFRDNIVASAGIGWVRPPAGLVGWLALKLK